METNSLALFGELQISFFLLCGGSHVQSSLLPEFALLFLHVSTCLDSRRGVTTSSSSCSGSWRTTRSLRSLVQIGSTCSIGTPSSRTCNARDALGADGSTRELSRAHSFHIASLPASISSAALLRGDLCCVLTQTHFSVAKKSDKKAKTL